MRSSERRSAALYAGWVSLMSADAWAETDVEVRPSLTYSEIYDDNLFATPAGQQDAFLARLGPQLELQATSGRGRWLLRYAIEAETFHDHPEIPTRIGYQRGSLELTHHLTPRLELSGTAALWETTAPYDLNLPAVDTGDLRIRGANLGGAAAYALSATTTSTLRYTLADQALAGVRTDTHRVDVELTHRISELDALSLTASYEGFVFAPRENVWSTLLLVGWSHTLAPHFDFSLRGGPRLTQDAGNWSWDSEALAAVHYEQAGTTAAVTCTRTLAAMAGYASALKTDALALEAGHLFGRLRVGAGASVWRGHSAATSTAALTFDGDATWSVTDYLSLLASARVAQQRFSAVGADSVRVPHDRFLVGVRLTTEPSHAE